MAVQRVQLTQRNVQRLLDRIGETELNRRADNVLAIARQLAPRSDGSRSFTDGRAGVAAGGRLANSLKKTSVQTTRDGRQIRVFSDAVNSRGQSYARFVIKGTRPHVIRARNQPNLKFFWINGGIPMRIRRVNHPGTRPNNFLVEALRRGFRR